MTREYLRKAFVKGLRYYVATITVVLGGYALFALFFSTDEEKRLARENALYEQRYGAMVEREKLLSSAIEALQLRDNSLYEGLFHAAVPALDPLDAADVIADSDSLSDSFFLSYSASKSENVRKMADRVEEDFRVVFDSLVERRDSLPPLTAPIADLTEAQPAASIGIRHNPLLQVDLRHDGFDLIVPEGEPVLAAANGRVSAVGRGSGGLGIVVEIDHQNGYRTRYAGLGEVLVSKGMTVSRGRKLGTVGISGGSFAPHLHYEVLRGDEVLDPVHCLFASLTPDRYASILYTSVSTGQSLD